MPHDHACTDPACGCGHDHGADHGPRPPVATAPAPWRPAPGIAVTTAAVFLRDGQILCAPVHADDGTIKGWRPLGGPVAPGEQAACAVQRRIADSTGQQITDLAPLGVLEHVYRHEGATGHEIVFAFTARFVTPEIYEADALALTLAGRPDEAKWVSLAKARAGRLMLWPEGLADLLPG